MFDVPFVSRMAIAIIVTFLAFIISLFTIIDSMVFTLTMAIAAFGYQILDWAIYNLRKK